MSMTLSSIATCSLQHAVSLIAVPGQSNMRSNGGSPTNSLTSMGTLLGPAATRNCNRTLRRSLCSGCVDSHLKVATPHQLSLKHGPPLSATLPTLYAKRGQHTYSHRLLPTFPVARSSSYPP